MWRLIQGKNARATDKKYYVQKMTYWLGVIIDDQELALLANKGPKLIVTLLCIYMVYYKFLQ